MAETPKLIEDWNSLKECTSETHHLEIDIKTGSGWIVNSQSKENKYYLSTHSFYGSNYKHSTKLLQECGFNVQLANWDE